MKVSTLISYLEEFSQDKEVELFEISDFYDTILLAIKEENDKVVLKIKNVIRDEGTKVEQ